MIKPSLLVAACRVPVENTPLTIESSLDIPLQELDIPTGSAERNIKTALASYLEVAEARFRDYVVEQHENGNITVRPEAVFG
jgi:hypothetical protein